jgi:hypothetical protein
MKEIELVNSKHADVPIKIKSSSRGIWPNRQGSEALEVNEWPSYNDFSSCILCFFVGVFVDHTHKAFNQQRLFKFLNRERGISLYCKSPPNLNFLTRYFGWETVR